MGAFPDTRYFAVVDNDDHYAATEHVADLAMDPVGQTTLSGYTSFANPFVVGLGGGGGSLPYASGNYWMVPISLGTVPANSTAIKQYGCNIDPTENDNLIDATWRHLSMDWNTTVSDTYPNVVDLAGISDPLPAHVVNLPDPVQPTSLPGFNTDGWNLGGTIITREYLLPGLNCSGSPFTSGTEGTLGCQQDASFGNVYLIVRDTQTGCAYTAAQAQEYFVYGASGSTVSLDNAVASVTQPSPDTNWRNSAQSTAHVDVGDTTPEACFADGSGNSNIAAWARSPEYNGQPGPDDAYIGAAVSSSYLSDTLQSGDVLLLQFALPNMPNTPCVSPYSCALTGNEQLRYMSITLEQDQGTPSPGAIIADPDNVSGQTSNAPLALISLADSAFTGATNSWGSDFNLVNLVINTTSGGLPGWLTQNSPYATPITQGVSPVLIQPNSLGTCSDSNPSTTYTTCYNYYAAWQINVTVEGVPSNYVVVDLSHFNGSGGTRGFSSGGQPVSLPTFTPTEDLLIQIRSALPNPNFACSGFAVPFSTAVYTPNGGLMGPYAPYVTLWQPAIARRFIQHRAVSPPQWPTVATRRDTPSI